jgi:asparagine synthase (glutamine-hydrolysing)
MIMKAIIAVLDKNGSDSTTRIIGVLKSMSPLNALDLGIVTPSMSSLDVKSEEWNNKQWYSPIACGYYSSNQSRKPQFVKSREATLVFQGRVYGSTSRVAFRDAVGNESTNTVLGLKNLISNTEGDFAFVLIEPERIIAGRDPVGVEPLYYGENSEIIGFASNRKALWNLGLEKTMSFPPGHIAIINRESITAEPVKTLNYTEPHPVTMQAAAAKLQKLLELSVRKRLLNIKKVAIAFSGGLDSSVIGALAKKCKVEIDLIHVSLKDHPETEPAKRAAEELNLPLQLHFFSDIDVGKTLPKVIELVEEPDPIKASVGLSFYWVAEKAAQAGFDVLLAGQGADELFGGYQRYVNDYIIHGDEHVGRVMFEDVAKIHESNIERDVKICDFHDVELRLPFASFEVAEFAMSLPIDLKIERKPDSLRKLVLRKMAEDLGLSKMIVQKTKKAVQYSTGINEAIKKLARKRGITVNEYATKLFQESRGKQNKSNKEN